MELHAVATNVREDLAGHQYRDEGVLERDSPAQECEADDHRDESNADAAQELRDQRGLEGDANRAHRDGVLGVRYGGDLIRPVFDGAQGA